MQKYWFFLVFAVIFLAYIFNGIRSGCFSYFGLESDRRSGPKFYALLGVANICVALLAISGFVFGYQGGLANAPPWLFNGFLVFCLSGAFAIAIKLSQAIRAKTYTRGSESYTNSDSPFLFWLMLALQLLWAFLLLVAVYLTVEYQYFARPT